MNRTQEYIRIAHSVLFFILLCIPSNVFLTDTSYAMDFSSFHVHKRHFGESIKFSKPVHLLAGRFTLADGANGIHPPEEVVELIIEGSGGSVIFSKTIPSESFEEKGSWRGKTQYVYMEFGDGAFLRFVIKEKKPGQYHFRFFALKHSLGCCLSPKFITLVIGDDFGTFDVETRGQVSTPIVIDQEGGVVPSFDGKADVAIPEDAVSSPVEITVSSVPDLSSPPWGATIPGTTYEFSPSGLQFLIPAIISIDIPPGTIVSSLRIARENNGTPLGLPSIVSDGTVKALTDHFTRFAVVSAADITPPSSPPTNVILQAVQNEPEKVDISWTNSSSPDAATTKIYRSSTQGVLSDVVDPIFGPQEIFKDLPLTTTSVTDTMQAGLNCYTVRAADAAGNETQNTDQQCRLFIPPDLSVSGGTFTDQATGLVGTVFLFDPNTSSGTVSNVMIQGPSGWNGDVPFNALLVQPSGIAPDRALANIFTPPLTGDYTAQATLSQGMFSIDATSTLSAPSISQALFDVGLGEVFFRWSITENAGSFLLRVDDNATSALVGELVVAGALREFTLGGLALAGGTQYRVTVFAFSEDLTTSNPIQNQFNVGAHTILVTTP